MLCLRQLRLPSRSSRQKYICPTDYKSNSANDPFSYYPFILTTAAIEIVYYSPPLSLLVSPPDSPRLLPVVAWSDNQAIEIANIIATMKIAPTSLSYYFSSSETLFGNLLPTLSPCPNCTTKSSLQVTIELV
jgi:hypothetical protein